MRSTYSSAGGNPLLFDAPEDLWDSCLNQVPHPVLEVGKNARSAGNLIGVSPSSVTKMSKNVSKAIFERELTAKDLITELMEIA